MNKLILAVFFLATLIPRIEVPVPQITDKVCVVLDVSGSMTMGLKDSIDIIKSVAETPTDGLEIKVFTFADNMVVWPFGWMQLPSKDDLDKANAWLNKRKAISKRTYLSEALEKATQEDKKDCTVLVITDGILDDDPKKLKEIADKSKHPLIFVVIDGTKDSLKENIMPMTKEGVRGVIVMEYEEEEDGQ